MVGEPAEPVNLETGTGRMVVRTNNQEVKEKQKARTR